MAIDVDPESPNFNTIVREIELPLYKPGIINRFLLTFLLAVGANPDAKDARGRTALHRRIGPWLPSNGPSGTRRPSHGPSPLSSAERS